MGWTKILAESELPAGSRQVVTVSGQKILVINHESKIYAVANICPHMKLPMKSGKITPEGTIVCPFHRSAFDLCTGEAQSWTPFPPVIGPMMGKIKGETPLPTFPTRMDEGSIWVDA